ncbi:MAG TPA: type I-E CRISPR-associated protein Cas7/Cse4/CasC [Acidobacteriota bacterium]|nr:type I-E CRISPR-associated protein Cas7/Cse4/CasC [Acidobacteriota bacterium]
MSRRFIQVHTLTSYPASLLNRDDVGFAKRIPFGGAERTRISSQCLKRHWRTADDQWALDRISSNGGQVPMAVRSRRIFEKHVYEPLVAEGVEEETAKKAVEALIEVVLPKGKAKARAKAAEEGEEEEGKTELQTSQVIVLGRPEVEYLLKVARDQVSEAQSQGKDVAKQVKGIKGDLKKNLLVLRKEPGLGPGLDAALFGRMTTGDVLARCDAAVHVAHAFTVHSGQFETDYFSAIDDLQGREETGSGHINTSELSSGLFYGYVVVDVPLLVSNIEGSERGDWATADRTLAADVVRHLVHLIATVSPGAKLGSTAPYAHASTVLIENGNQQPRTLANAFLNPVDHRNGGQEATAAGALFDYLARHHEMYPSDTRRAVASMIELENVEGLSDRQASLPELAEWAAACVQGEA